MKKRTILYLVSLLILISLTLSACSSLSSEQRNAANDALVALEKLNTSREVHGLDVWQNEQYKEYLIDARTKVNKAIEILPNGELKAELTLTNDAFFDESFVEKYRSEVKNVGGETCDLTLGLDPKQKESEFDRTLKRMIEKYNLQSFTKKNMFNRTTLSCNDAVVKIRESSKIHLENTRKLLQGK